jgi:hypothetical protein
MSSQASKSLEVFVNLNRARDYVIQIELPEFFGRASIRANLAINNL